MVTIMTESLHLMLDRRFLECEIAREDVFVGRTISG